MPKPKYIGIAGTFASGKDTLGHFLINKYGYALGSTSDVVRKFSIERHGSIERPFLHETADYYRKTKSADFFVKHVMNDYDQKSVGLAISGLRTMGEANSVLEAGGVIVFIDAPSELRYKRMQERTRDAESMVSYDEFIKREQSEWHRGDEPGDFSFKNLKAKADYLLENGDDTELFYKTAEKALGL